MQRIVWHGSLFCCRGVPRLVRSSHEASPRALVPSIMRVTQCELPAARPVVSRMCLSTSFLDEFVGLSIEQICPLKFGTVGDVHNHCAHFVGHVLKLNGSVINGLTCAGMVNAGKKRPGAGALVRVNDIFNFCVTIEEANPLGCLVYYTLPGNISADGTMGSMRQKHVGICIEGYVYNYGNTNDKVRKDRVGDLAKLYGNKTITRYTDLPMGHTVLTLDEIEGLAG